MQTMLLTMLNDITSFIGQIFYAMFIVGVAVLVTYTLSAVVFTAYFNAKFTYSQKLAKNLKAQLQTLNNVRNN